MNRPALTLIAAVARNGAIGLGNELLWSEPEDQKHFRRVTLGSAVIMGRKTWDSLPARFRPLPGRRNIVLTRDPTWQAPGALAVGSIGAALDQLSQLDPPNPLIPLDVAPRAFVIGGAEIYALALPLADTLVLTEIDADLRGDTFFPAWDRAGFSAVSSEAHTSADGVGYRFVTYQKIQGT